ncbi:putative transcription factor MADS-type1 family [Dioscorea sansibarensis]
MGRHKLPMKKINEESNLQVTYSKRKKGLMKKTYELSVLSDVDAAFISISGASRVSFFSGTTSVEDLFSLYMESPESEQKFSRAERERITEILNNIKMQNESSQHTAEFSLSQVVIF